jgi:hypothetical protein
MHPESIKRSELLHFSHLVSRDEVLVLEPAKRSEIVENALTELYRLPSKTERDDLLSLIQTIMKGEPAISNRFEQTAYTVCNRHLVITFVNQLFLKRSNVQASTILGKSLYFEREYEGTQIEQLYSMVMETRLLADALVRYVGHTASGIRYDGWFVLVVIPLDDGGIGVLSRFAKNREDVANEIDATQPDAPRFIALNS